MEVNDGWIEVTGLMWRRRTMSTQAVNQAIKKEKVHEYEIANKQIGFSFLVPNSSKERGARANEHNRSVYPCTSQGLLHLWVKEKYP